VPFPQGFPDGCPPADAEDASGVVHRIVIQSPPGADDFRTYEEMGITHGQPCKRRGLSTYRKKEDAIHQQGLYPRLGRYIAAGELNATHGKVDVPRSPRNSHVTWWPYDGVDRVAPFRIVFEIPDAP